MTSPKGPAEAGACWVCGASGYATVVIAGDLWAPYVVCFEHRHHERRILKGAEERAAVQPPCGAQMSPEEGDKRAYFCTRPPHEDRMHQCVLRTRPDGRQDAYVWEEGAAAPPPAPDRLAEIRARADDRETLRMQRTAYELAIETIMEESAPGDPTWVFCRDTLRSVRAVSAPPRSTGETNEYRVVFPSGREAQAPSANLEHAEGAARYFASEGARLEHRRVSPWVAAEVRAEAPAASPPDAAAPTGEEEKRSDS